MLDDGQIVFWHMLVFILVGIIIMTSLLAFVVGSPPILIPVTTFIDDYECSRNTGGESFNRFKEEYHGKIIILKGAQVTGPYLNGSDLFLYQSDLKPLDSRPKNLRVRVGTIGPNYLMLELIWVE